jgi:hypothetical protein
MSIRRLMAILWAGFMVSMAGAAVAALSLKRRIATSASPDADEVTLVAIFEPIAFESRATSFRGGRAELWYGGGIIDLRHATLDPAGATLQVRAVFGGCQVLIPASWQVTTRVMGIGGAGDGRPRIERAPGAPHLTIEGTAFFGGFGVTSDIPADAERSVREAVAKRAQHVDGGAGVPVMERETVTT